jgi:nitrogen regulatory protein PII
VIRVTAIIRPHKLEEVKTAVSGLGISGITVTDVRGTGNRPEKAAVFAGQEILVALPIRSKVEIVCENELKNDLIALMLHHAHTGEPGDGKVFVEEVVGAHRIRTGESGGAVV